MGWEDVKQILGIFKRKPVFVGRYNAAETNTTTKGKEAEVDNTDGTEGIFLTVGTTKVYIPAGECRRHYFGSFTGFKTEPNTNWSSVDTVNGDGKYEVRIYDS